MFVAVEEVAAAPDVPDAPVVLVCDHASNALPGDYGRLGLAAEQFECHIAHDIGAAEVTRQLAKRLNCPAVLAGFSRLLIDPNRGVDDPTLVMQLSDGAIIPGNHGIDGVELQHRKENFYERYHGAIGSRIDAMLAQGKVPVVVSIHSFTPDWRGQKRAWECGILWDKDFRLAGLLLAGLRARGFAAGDNQPYSGRLKGDTLYTHGTMRGLAHALIELRQDLVETQEQQQAWAAELAALLREVFAAHRDSLFRIEKFGSHTD